MRFDAGSCIPRGGNLLAIPALISAQPVSIGVKAGVPITDAFESFRGNSVYYATPTKRYLIEPTVQFNINRFSVKVDALYRRLVYQYEQTAPGLITAKTVLRSNRNQGDFLVGFTF